MEANKGLSTSLGQELFELKGTLVSMNQSLAKAFECLDKVEQVLRERLPKPSALNPEETSAVNACASTSAPPPSTIEDGGGASTRGIKRTFDTAVSQGHQQAGLPRAGYPPMDTRKRRMIVPSQPPDELAPREERVGRLAALSDELLAYIFDFLDVPSLCQLSRVCASIRAIAESYPWRKIFQERYTTLEMQSLARVKDDPFFRWKSMVVEGAGLVKRWREPPPPPTSLRGHNRPVSYLQFLGNKLLSCDDSVMRQWELSTGKAVVSFATDAKNKCYHFQFDEERLVVSNVDAVRVYDGETSEFLYLLEGVESYANRLKLTSEFIVGGMWDGYIRTWKISNRGKLSAKYFGHLLPVYCLDAVSDKIVSGSSDKWIKVYDAQLQTTLSTLKGHTMTVTTLQLNEKLGCMHSGSRDKCIIRWDMRARNTPIHRWMGHDDMITCLQFDGFKLVTAGMDSVVKVWDVRTSKQLYSIAGNEGGVRCLQFCGPDLVFGGSDGNVHIYRQALI